MHLLSKNVGNRAKIKVQKNRRVDGLNDKKKMKQFKQFINTIKNK